MVLRFWSFRKLLRYWYRYCYQYDTGVAYFTCTDKICADTLTPVMYVYYHCKLCFCTLLYCFVLQYKNICGKTSQIIFIRCHDLTKYSVSVSTASPGTLLLLWNQVLRLLFLWCPPGFARYPMVGFIYRVNSTSSEEIWLWAASSSHLSDAQWPAGGRRAPVVIMDLFKYHALCGPNNYTKYLYCTEWLMHMYFKHVMNNDAVFFAIH